MLPSKTNGHNTLVDHFMSEPLSTLSLGNSRDGHFFVKGPNLNRWSQPAVSIDKTEDGYEAEWDMPGLTREDVQITVRDGALRVEGSSGDRSYSYALALSDRIETDGIEAELEHGVLRVRLPAKETVGEEIPISGDSSR